MESTAGWLGRIEAVRAGLARTGPAGTQVPWRVATSVAQLGVAARLVAPVLGAAVMRHEVLPLGPDEVWWQDQLGGPFPLAFPPTAARDRIDDPALRLAVLGDRLLAGPVARMVAITELLSVSPRVLWGNVASALNGAAAMIGQARPELAASAAASSAALLSYPPLREASEGAIGPSFRRRSCCLIYQVAGGRQRAVCGDCVLRR